MEISSLSIKVSGSFISIPEGLKALTQFNLALLYFSSLYFLFSPHPPDLLPLYPRPLPRWVGVGVGVHAVGSAPQQD